MGVISVLQVSGQVTLQPSKCHPCPSLPPIFLLSLPSSFINLMSIGCVLTTVVAHGQGAESITINKIRVLDIMEFIRPLHR